MASIRTSRAGEPGFKLGKKYLIENEPSKGVSYWYARRDDLNAGLHANNFCSIAVFLGRYGELPNEETDEVCLFVIEHGVTQRNKKFVQIGCKRFVGENRRKLIAWAKSAR